MSTLKVDSLVEKTSGNGVHIAGHVIQVVGTSTGTTTELTGVNYVDTASTATITPKFSTSKILVMHSAGGLFINHDTTGNNTSNSALLQLKRNGSVTGFNQSRWAFNTTGWWIGVNWSFSYLDSPSTTSALTYLIAIGKDASSGNIRHNDSDGTISGNPRLATLTLMEIAQ